MKKLTVLTQKAHMLSLIAAASTHGAVGGARPLTPTLTGRTPTKPEPQRFPSPDRLKVPKGAETLQGIAQVLSDPTAHGLTRVAGRTLPKGHQWFGHEIPGRGGAAARRLRQQAKQTAKKGQHGTSDPAE